MSGRWNGEIWDAQELDELFEQMSVTQRRTFQRLEPAECERRWPGSTSLPERRPRAFGAVLAILVVTGVVAVALCLM